MYINNISLNSSYVEKRLRQKLQRNQNTHFVFNNIFFFENHAVYDTMWENTVEQDRPQMTV